MTVALRSVMFHVAVFDCVSFINLGCLEFSFDPSSDMVWSGIQAFILGPSGLDASFCAWGRVFAFMLNRGIDTMFEDHPLVVLVISVPVNNPTHALLDAIVHVASLGRTYGCHPPVVSSANIATVINWRQLAYACDPLHVLLSKDMIDISPNPPFYLRRAFCFCTTSTRPPSIPSCSVADSPWLHDSAITCRTNAFTTLRRMREHIHNSENRICIAARTVITQPMSATLPYPK